MTDIIGLLGRDVLIFTLSFLKRVDLDKIYISCPDIVKEVELHEMIDIKLPVFARYPNAKSLTVYLDKNLDYNILRKAEKLCLDYSDLTEYEPLDGLHRMANLRELGICNYCGPIEGLRHLATLEKLKIRDGTPITGEVLSHLKNLKNIELEYTTIGEDVFANLKQITTFSSANCDFDGRNLIKLENLENLSLDRNVQLANEDFAPLKKLVSLNLNRCSSLTGCCFMHVPNLKKLTVTDHDYIGHMDFVQLTKLEEVTLTGCPFVSDKTFKFTPLIKKLATYNCHMLKGNFPKYLPNLKDLKMHHCDNVVLCECPGLISLDIGGIGLCPKMLSKTKTIEVLHMRGHCDLDSIEELGLRELVISDNYAIATVLRQLVTLQKLEINDCNIDDDDISQLVNLTDLKVSECPTFTGDCLCDLKKLTKLSVERCTRFSSSNLECLTTLDRLEIIGSAMTGSGLSNLKYIGYLELVFCERFDPCYLKNTIVMNMKPITRVKH